MVGRLYAQERLGIGTRDQAALAGRTVSLSGHALEVIGIYATGNDFGDNHVFVPLETFRRIYNPGDKLSKIRVTVDSVANVEAVSRQAYPLVARGSCRRFPSPPMQNPSSRGRAQDLGNFAGRFAAAAQVAEVVLMQDDRARTVELLALRSATDNRLEVEIGQSGGQASLDQVQCLDRADVIVLRVR